MSDNYINPRRTFINLTCSFGVMLIGFAISFFLSPYIIRTIGIEANGFVSLANSFVSYANLAVLALNAMAARFITLAYIQEDYKRANLYYNSVFWGNLILAGILFLPGLVLVLNLESVIQIPGNMQTDVKILFAMVFLLFLVKTAFPNWDCGTRVSNRLDREHIPSMLTSLLRCVLLVGMFTLFRPRVWYVTLTSTITGFITLGFAGYNTHVLTPELRINFRKPICNKSVVKELVGSGIWSALASSGNILLNGLDLLMCNLFVGSTAMGILSLSKTIPSILVQFAETIRGTFGPELTIAYAKGNKDDMIHGIRRSMKIASILVSTATAGVIVMCDAFYSLWVPTQNAQLLQQLTTLAILGYLTDSGIYVLGNVFPTYNRVKYNTYALLATGFVSIFLTFLFVRFTDWDIYAVAGISSLVTIVKSLIFMVPVTSKLLGLKWNTFYPQVLQSLLSCAVVIGIGLLVRQIVAINSWIMFFLTAAVIAVLGMVANMVIILSKGEREYLIAIFIRRLIKRS